jgi:hypothetical protein
MRCGADMADTLSALTSSVTMSHTASRSFVAEWHIVTCHVFEVLWVWSVAKAVYRHCQTARCHHQLLRKDGSMSAVALGVGLGSLRIVLASQFNRCWCATATAKLHNAALLKVLVQSVASSLFVPTPLRALRV